MYPSPPVALWLSFFPLLIMTIPLGIICYHLAQNKGLRVVPWTFWGFIPLVKYFILLYLIGAKDKLIDDKLHNIIRILEALKITAHSKESAFSGQLSAISLMIKISKIWGWKKSDICSYDCLHFVFAEAERSLQG